VLPDPQYAPTRSLQSCAIPKIPSNVAVQLSCPPLTIRSRARGVLWASVPKAPIDEHGEPQSWEKDVDLAAKAG
jgi:hypothetical protein